MTTYVYETIPRDPDESPVRFEVRQRMSDPPLERHPDTGQPVRRVVSGGMGILQKGAAAPPPSACCGGGG